MKLMSNLHGGSTEEALGSPIAQHRLVRSLPSPSTSRRAIYLMIEGDASTEPSQVADVLFQSPAASGYSPFYFLCATHHEEAHKEDRPTGLDLIRDVYSHVRGCSSLQHHPGQWRPAGKGVRGTSGLPLEFEELRYQVLRNTLASNFTDPLKREERREAIDLSAFLSRLYRMLKEGDEKGATLLIYAYFYQLRMRKDFDLCDRILDDVNEKQLPPALLVALLTITAPLRDNLRRRAHFFKRAKEAIAEARGPEAVGRILIGLE